MTDNSDCVSATPPVLLMFAFIRRLLGRPPTRTTFVTPVSGLPAVVERQAEAQAVAVTESPFFRRDTVLDRMQRIAGYRFQLPDTVRARLAGKSPTLRRAYDDVLIRNLALSNVQAALANRIVFLCLAPESLVNPQLRELPAANVVVLLDPAEGALPPPVDQCQAVRQLGFRLGWPLRLGDGGAVDLAEFDVVQLATPAYDGLQIADAARRLKRDCEGGRPLLLFATEVETADDFHLCLRAQLDYFQGPFVHQAETLTPPRGNVNRGLITRVLAQLRSGADGRELAATISQDAVVTYKLLRYINAPANGLTSEISSIEQCLLLLGRDRFYRWLSLLLFDIQPTGFAERVITEQALVRASLMERLGRAAGMAGATADHLFLAGLFSMLGRLLNQPLDVLLAGVSVPPAVAEVLLKDSGPLAPFLGLVVASESGRQDVVERGLSACGVDAVTLNTQSLEALAWANAIVDGVVE